jgi:3-hydroxy acid dehydrogenase / malonic semialdehyde reductase
MTKTIFITGASSGIGRALALKCAKEGDRVLMCARREDQLKELACEIKEKYKTDAYAFTLDVSDKKKVDEAMSHLPAEWQEIDVLVNNAGLSLGLNPIHECSTEDWDKMIDINIKGLLYMSKAVIEKMLKRNKGQIINIGSISSYEVYKGGMVYCATKFAVRAINEGIKYDCHGTPIRVSMVAPGMIETEFSMVRFKGDKEKAEDVYKGMTPLSVDDVVEAVCFCISRPEHVNIRELLIMPTDQTSNYAVHKK